MAGAAFTMSCVRMRVASRDWWASRLHPSHRLSPNMRIAMPCSEDRYHTLSIVGLPTSHYTWPSKYCNGNEALDCTCQGDSWWPSINISVIFVSLGGTKSILT